ncbi:uncharacterized protein [Ptychodera flava]|uniref:uncharacterized protein n=1 Tax=Ptychodera flava TaxID=63121 RepID=UPI003969BBC4
MKALLVSTSWNKDTKGSTTWQLISDFCEETLKMKPCQLSAIHCTVLNVEISEEQEEDAARHGVTLIPATRPKWSNPAEDPPAINWLLHHDRYYLTLAKLEDITHVVGLSAKTHNAASAIHESLFKNAKLHLLSSKPAALFVGDSWNKDKLGLTGFHRNLVQDFCERKAKAGEYLKAYSTVLDVNISDDQKKDAESCGVTLIPAQIKELADPEDELPALKRLAHHPTYYPDLKELENIQYVIGYGPTTGLAAADIRAKLFPGARLVLINHACPEDNCLQTIKSLQNFEEKMLTMASKADLIFSIGPKIHQYFQNAYRAEVNGKYLSEIPHEEILPRPVSCQLGKDPKEGEIQQHHILTCGQIDTQEALERCDVMAASIGTAANLRKANYTSTPRWKIQGVYQQADKTTEKLLSNKMQCPYITPTLHPGHSVKALLRSLQQSHLCLPAPCYVDYSFYGLEAMVSGLPTAVYEDSHIAHFIMKYFKDHADYSIVRSPEQNLSDTIVKCLKNTAGSFKRAKQLKTDLVNSEVISTSYARFVTLLTTTVQRQSGDDSKGQGVEKDDKESLDVQIDLDNHVYDQHLKEVEEELKALPAQLKKEKIEEVITKLKSAWRDCKWALKRKVDEVVADENDCGDVKKVCKKKLGDEVDAKSLREKSLAILLRLLTLYNLYRVKQTCRCGSLAKAFEPLLITDEMREIAAEVGIKLQLKATYNPERFKELELFFINRDGGGIQPMKIHDVLAEDSDEDVQMSSNKAEETGYIGDNVTEISLDNFKEEKDPSKLLLLEIDPALEIKSSTETSVQTMFKAEKCIRLKGRQCDMLQVLTTNTDTVQHILSCRQDVLALLGVTRYLLTDAPTRDLTNQEMQLQFIRDVLSNSNSLTLPVSDENVSLLARSLLPCQISQIQITEYIVELSARINEKEIDLQKSVLQHQLDEAKQEKATLVENIRKLTQTIDITEKELTNRVGIESVNSSELEEKEKIISDLKAKLSALEEIQSELELQGMAEMKVGSQYSEEEEGIKDQDVIGTKWDYASSKTKVPDNEEDKTIQQSTTVREGREMETATPTQPEMTVREGRREVRWRQPHHHNLR